MADRRISTEPRALEDLLREIIARLDRLDGGATAASWPVFPDKILIGDGALVVRHTNVTPDELELLLVNNVPGPPWTSFVSLGIVP